MSSEVVRSVPRTSAGQAWREVGLLWVASRVFFEGVALIVVTVHGRVPDDRPGFAGILHHWDSNWFSAVLLHGYFGPSYVDAGTAPARPAFFPGYPLAGRALAWLAGGGQVTSGSAVVALWFVPFVASLVAALFLYRLAAQRFDVAVARWSAGLLLFGPVSVFLVASYSEALYLAFAVGAWWALTRRNHLVAGLLGAGASFTRVNGGFLAVALLVGYVAQQRAAGRRPRPGALAALTTSFVGVAGYLAWLWATTGHATAWFDAQSGRFAHRAVWPWTAAVNQLKQPVVDATWDHKLQSTLEIVAVLGLLAALVVLVRTREWPAAVYLALSLVPFLTNSTYQSLARNSITLFPVTVLAAVVVVRSRDDDGSSSP